MRSHFPLTTLTTMRCVTLAVCVVATACGRATATSPTSPTGAGGGIENTEARGGQQLPFRGSLQAQETDVVAPPSLLVTGTATGTATQLGRFENTFTAIVDLATGKATGTITFTAANGDRLDATLVGQGTPTSEPNVASIVEVVTITGGTGRFADATGTFTIHRVLDQNSGVSSGSFEGTINPSR